jgi:hypothetical protein
MVKKKSDKADGITQRPRKREQQEQAEVPPRGTRKGEHGIEHADNDVGR